MMCDWSIKQDRLLVTPDGMVFDMKEYQLYYDSMGHDLLSWIKDGYDFKGREVFNYDYYDQEE